MMAEMYLLYILLKTRINHNDVKLPSLEALAKRRS